MTTPASPASDKVSHLLEMGLDDSLAVQARAFQPGDEVGNYVVRKKLGEGGFGVVWLAEQLRPVKREVALKILRAGVDVMAAEERFRMEGHALARMNHPCIAAVLDMDVLPGGQPYFVMELVNGTPITRYAKDHHLDLRQRLQLMIDVCLAVQHAHQRAVLHRDLKPSNILVTEVDGQPVPKVIDFGIAKALSDDLHHDLTLAVTARGVMMGTPQYMAPEQAAFSSEGADARSDVYALGVILFELITGTTPVGGTATDALSLPALLRRVCEDEPQRPSVLSRSQLDKAASVPKDMRRGELEELDWLVLKALEKSPDRRYATAAALADDLTAFLNREALSVGPPGLAYRINKLVQRNKLPVAAGLLVIVGLGMSAFISFKAYLDESRAHARAEALMLRALAGERNARLQTERADDAIGFLSEVLREAGERIRAGENATAVRAGLQKAEEQLGTLEAQPELELILARQLAEVYQTMGDDRHAITLRERVLGLLTSLRGDTAKETHDARRELAYVYHSTGRHRDAVPLYEQLVAHYQTQGRAAQRDWFDVSRRLASALEIIDRRDDSIQLLARLMDADDGAGKLGRENSTLVRNYAEQLARVGDVAGARATIENALKDLSPKKSSSRKSRPTLIAALARIEAREGRYVESARHFREAMEQSAQSADASVQDSIDLLIEEARTWKRANQFDTAMATLDQAQDMASRADNVKQVVHCLDARATLCEESHRPADAATARQEILRIHAATQSVSFKMMISSFAYLIRDLRVTLQDDEALRIAREFWPVIIAHEEIGDHWGTSVAVLRHMLFVAERWQAAHPAESIQKDIDQWKLKLAECEAEAKRLGRTVPDI